MEDLSGRYAMLGLEGPGAAALGAEGFREGITAAGGAGGRVYVEESGREALVARWTALGVAAADAEAVNAVRLENARPRYGVDVKETNLVQETRLMHAVSFAKGCYLGQEIVERVRSLAKPHKYLAQVWIDGEAVPEAGAALMGGEALAGRITSAAWSPAMGKVAALAYVQTAWAEAGKEMTCGGARAVVSERGVA